jgi:hypothetical protein
VRFWPKDVSSLVLCRKTVEGIAIFRAKSRKMTLAIIQMSFSSVFMSFSSVFKSLPSSVLNSVSFSGASSVDGAINHSSSVCFFISAIPGHHPSPGLVLKSRQQGSANGKVQSQAIGSLGMLRWAGDRLLC